MKTVDEVMLERYLTDMLENKSSGCAYLLKNDMFEELHRMYRMCARLPSRGLQDLSEQFRRYVAEQGNHRIAQAAAAQSAAEESKAVSSSSSSSASAASASIADKDGTVASSSAVAGSGGPDDPHFVSDMLSFHDKQMGLVTEQFGNSSLFQKALKEAFAEFMNRDVGKFKIADMLSTFCDRMLRGAGEKLSDEATEMNLERVVQLFSYLSDKDVFADIYRHQLAKRILTNKSSSDDMERIMIGKLKLRCGAQFTGKMEGMMNDLSIGTDHQSDFDRHVEQMGVSTLGFGRGDFEVQVLTTGH